MRPTKKEAGTLAHYSLQRGVIKKLLERLMHIPANDQLGMSYFPPEMLGIILLQIVHVSLVAPEMVTFIWLISSTVSQPAGVQSAESNSR